MNKLLFACLSMKNYVRALAISAISITAMSSTAFAGVAPYVECDGTIYPGCGYEMEVRCESPDDSLYSGSLECVEPWYCFYEFYYDAGDDGVDPSDFVCAGEIAADTNKYEVKCTNVLKGNGKSSDELTIDMEMKFDPDAECDD